MTDQTLRDQLAEVEARAEALRRRIASESCATAGHNWRHVGGKNAGCERDCGCSIPVHQCTVCGDCDYGDNAWAVETRDECRRFRRTYHD